MALDQRCVIPVKKNGTRGTSILFVIYQMSYLINDISMVHSSSSFFNELIDDFKQIARLQLRACRAAERFSYKTFLADEKNAVYAILAHKKCGKGQPGKGKGIELYTYAFLGEVALESVVLKVFIQS